MTYILLYRNIHICSWHILLASYERITVLCACSMKEVLYNTSKRLSERTPVLVNTRSGDPLLTVHLHDNDTKFEHHETL